MQNDKTAFSLQIKYLSLRNSQFLFEHDPRDRLKERRSCQGSGICEESFILRKKIVEINFIAQCYIIPSILNINKSVADLLKLWMILFSDAEKYSQHSQTIILVKCFSSILILSV